MDYTRNVKRIRDEGFRAVVGKIPAQVRKELYEGVKAGHLVRLPKKSLAPEIFCHPDHVLEAKNAQNEQAKYAAECIAKVMIS